MFALIYSAAYTEYTVEIVSTVEEAERLCRERFGLRNSKFGQTDEGVFYTIGYGDEGLILLSLQEIVSAP
jgi:hypothetical protein